MFGNNADDGYNAKSYQYKPKWEKTVDYNPDHQCSQSDLYIDILEPDTRRIILQVKGLGVIVVHASLANHDVRMAIFDKDDIGPCPNI